jgi:hypothetical protein
VDPRAGLNTLEKKKESLAPVRNEPLLLGHLAIAYGFYGSN